MENFAQLFYKTAWTQGLKHDRHFARLKITKYIVHIQKFMKVLYYIV